MGTWVQNCVFVCGGMGQKSPGDPSVVSRNQCSLPDQQNHISLFPRSWAIKAKVLIESLLWQAPPLSQPWIFWSWFWSVMSCVPEDYRTSFRSILICLLQAKVQRNAHLLGHSQISLNVTLSHVQTMLPRCFQCNNGISNTSSWMSHYSYYRKFDVKRNPVQEWPLCKPASFHAVRGWLSAVGVLVKENLARLPFCAYSVQLFINQQLSPIPIPLHLAQWPIQPQMPTKTSHTERIQKFRKVKGTKKAKWQSPFSFLNSKFTRITC